ncbi:MAG: cytochrome c-type biogenesis protein CcmH [Gammaproteobacteria bacterium]|jgi:cytochrome c-type biogenesis protein CcmH
MSRLTIIAAAMLLGWSPVLAIDSQGPLPDPEMQARYERLTNELRCLVCQNQTVADSNADLARDLRDETREMLLEGASDEQIVAFMTERYGDFVLYRPPLSSRTLVLWAAPALLLLIGLIIVGRIIRRRSLAGDIPEDGEEAFPEPEPRDNQ